VWYDEPMGEGGLWRLFQSFDFLALRGFFLLEERFLALSVDSFRQLLRGCGNGALAGPGRGFIRSGK
jgi:hypothetical protein